MNDRDANIGTPSPPSLEEPSQESGSLDLTRYRRVLWEGRVRLLIAATIGFFIALVALQIIPYQYTATVIVGPPDATNSLSGASSALTSLSGLAGLASVFATAGSSDYDAYNQLLDSDALGDYVVQHNPDLLHQLYESRWNPDTKKWDNSGIINFAKDAAKVILGFQPWQVPNGEDIRKYIEKNVDVSNDYKTNFTTIAYTDEDPALAKALVDAIYLGADAIVRHRADERSSKRIAYLKTILPTVSQADQHEALIQLLATEEQTKMMVRADPYYAINPIVRPVVSQRPSWPPNVLVLIGFAVLAIGLEYARLLYLPQFSFLQTWRAFRARRRRKTVVASSSTAA